MSRCPATIKIGTWTILCRKYNFHKVHSGEYLSEDDTVFFLTWRYDEKWMSDSTKRHLETERNWMRVNSG
jgi:hypothetical protein